MRDLSQLRTIKLGILIISLILICAACDDHKRPADSQVEPYQLHGVNFGPYLKDQDPSNGTSIPPSQLDSLIKIIKPYARWVRSFGCTNGLIEVGRIAHENGLKAACGAWLSADSQANEEEIVNLIAGANNGWVDVAIVGSEVLARGDLTETVLIGYIDRVRHAIPDSVPVTTADVDEVLLRHPNIISAVDIVFANYYPFWAGIDIEHAVAAVHTNHQRLIHSSGGKQVVVSETGWPSCGTPIGNAVPNFENAGQYFVNVVSWARVNDVDLFYFEAFDERWKAQHEGPQGACWGIWDEDGHLKHWMRKTFEGVTIPDNWTNDDIPSGKDSETVRIKIRDNRNFDDDREVQVDMYEISTEWEMHESPLSQFCSVYFDNVYMTMGFIFRGDARTIRSSDIEYRR